MTLKADELATDIYIIMRVFNLGKDNVGLKLYVDPSTMEREGTLKFEPDHYIVTPGTSVELTSGADPDEEL